MALADALHALLRLSGATYSCVVERDSGRVLAEVGNGEAGSGDSEGVVPYSVPRWGTAVAAMFGTTSGDELDDVMITGRRSYHLVRPLGPDASVLVYLRLDRSRSNLAAARRELATVRLSGSPAPAASSGAAPSSTRSRGDAPATTPPRGVAATPPAPARVPAALAPPSGPARARRSTTSDPGDTATAARPRAAAAVVPRVRRSATPEGSTGLSGGSSGGAAARSAPDTARQIPLPRRAPGQSTPDAGPMRRRSDARSGRAGRSASPTEPDAAPDGFAMPTVLGQTWARDPGTLRRLLAGLRRMA